MTDNKIKIRKLPSLPTKVFNDRKKEHNKKAARRKVKYYV